MNPNDRVLAGDIGGTKTRLGLFSRGKTRPLVKVIETYPSREFPDLLHIIDRFMTLHPAVVSSACLGIAGPVIRGRVKTTNLPWIVSERAIQKQFKWPRVRVINDLVATALAIPFMKNEALFPLIKARAKTDGTRVLIAPGTGLGMAILACRDGTYIPIPSEGGHMDFGPNDKTQIRLWEFLHKRFGHVSIERVLSGSGLVNIFSWLKDGEGMAAPKWLLKRMRNTDPSRAISEGALTRNTPICVRALNMFIAVLGSVSGNMALGAMASGGVYLGGGILPKVLPGVRHAAFVEAYLNKGRFQGFLETVPVRVILDDRAALLGAACAALERDRP